MKKLTLETHRIKKPMSAVAPMIDTLHKVAATEKTKRQQQEKARQKGVAFPAIQPGDYVLVSVRTSRNQKLRAYWRGPFTVIKQKTPYLYEVRLIGQNATETNETVHVRRIRRYADRSCNVTARFEEAAQSQCNEFNIEKIVDHKYDHNAARLMLRVRYTGFTDAWDEWERLDFVLPYARRLAREYLETQARKEKVKHRAHVTRVLQEITERKTETEQKLKHALQPGMEVRARAYTFGHAWAKKQYKNKWKTAWVRGIVQALEGDSLVTVLWDGDDEAMTSKAAHLQRTGRTQTHPHAQ